MIKEFKQLTESIKSYEAYKVFKYCMYMPTKKKYDLKVNSWLCNENIKIYGYFEERHIKGIIVISLEGNDAAYRELQEETAITKDDIKLTHLMDFTYYLDDCYVEVYVGKLNKSVFVKGYENDLYWSGLDEDFFDVSKYAGEGNIVYIR